jgi:hypothetical protein
VRNEIACPSYLLMRGGKVAGQYTAELGYRAMQGEVVQDKCWWWEKI